MNNKEFIDAIFNMFGGEIYNSKVSNENEEESNQPQPE